MGLMIFFAMWLNVHDVATIGMLKCHKTVTKPSCTIVNAVNC